MGTNCLAPYLLSILLEPTLIATAALPSTPALSVRIIWVVSLLGRTGVPQGGVHFDDDGTPQILSGYMQNYMQSKCGGAWLADRFARRLGEKGILSVVSFQVSKFVWWRRVSDS